MSNLAEIVRIAQHSARSMSTCCLIVAVTQQAGALSELLADFESARLGRHDVPDGEELYADAFADVLSNVVAMAAFTAELLNTRTEGWAFATKLNLEKIPHR